MVNIAFMIGMLLMGIGNISKVGAFYQIAAAANFFVAGMFFTAIVKERGFGE